MSRSALLVLLAASQFGGLWAASSAAAASSAVVVFPVPGSRTATPKAQLVFRGVPLGRLGPITVRGSRSGSHSGRLMGDSDGNGASFLPGRPFTPGETVTVTTSLNVVRARNGTFRFTVVTPGGGIPPIHWPPAARQRGDVQGFRSRPDLSPVVVSVGSRAPQVHGEIFVAPQFGPVQDGPMILDRNGDLVWFKALQRDDSAADFRVQMYQGRPVLTWWQGYVTAGVGVGAGFINDASYRQIAVVHGANGLNADLHEFQLTSRGTALITAYSPVVWDTSSVHGPKRKTVLDCVVQEIDIPTGLLLFQWDSLDHVPLSDSYSPVPRQSGSPFDYFHINSVEPDRDGSLVISARNTWAVYKINPLTGDVTWRLGGRHSSFKLGRGVGFAFQHDARVRSTGDQFITIFDDGAGPPAVHRQSRGLRLRLDTQHMTAQMVTEHLHAPSLSASFEGNVQQLPSGDDFLGWGQSPYFSEFDTRGRLIVDGHFVDANASYRAYRFLWRGAPAKPPAIAASTSGPTTTVYASWNGSTSVSSWRVLGGNVSSSLTPVAKASKTGFETAIKLPAQRYVAVQALDGAGHLIGQSSAVQAGR